MPNRSTDALFQLVKSLEKSEKRNFKLFVKRNSASEELKITQVFDALDKMPEYNEETLMKRTRGITKQQLPNIKAHLYRQILTSLRLLDGSANSEIHLHEMMDYASILYNKGLYIQSLRTLERLKEYARDHNQQTFLLQALFFEKKIEALHITRSMQDRADQLSAESNRVSENLGLIGRLSNLSLQLYSWYIRHGHARNARDAAAVKQYFEVNLPPQTENLHGFYERLYLFQSYCWYAFIGQDLLLYYRYAQKWVDVFEENKPMISIETAHYIKGMHNLLGAHFDLQNYKKFNEALRIFEKFYHSDLVEHNINNKIQTFIYLYISKLNKHFMEGTFSEGLKMVPYIEEKLKEYEIYMDRHRVLVFYYKIASLYFGSGDNEKAIEFLNKIINWKVDLRTDLQCYSRLLHLIAHYELGNYDLMQYLVKSVYRFMAKMENLSGVEEEIFKFLRKSFSLSRPMIRKSFSELERKLEKYKDNKYETRAYMYLDVISWLKSKMEGVPVQQVIRERFLKNVKER